MAPSKNAQALPYAKDEKVLCFHGDLMYEAKIIEIRQGASGSGGNAKDGKSANGDRHRGGGGGGGDHGNEVKYLVHYKGWKSSWDDWVTADRIRKFDDENKILASTLKNAAQSRGQGGHHYGRGGPVGGPGKKGAPDLSSARGSEERGSGAPSFAGRGPRRGRDYELENVSPFQQVSFPHYYFPMVFLIFYLLFHSYFLFLARSVCISVLLSPPVRNDLEISKGIFPTLRSLAMSGTRNTRLSLWTGAL